MKVARVILSSFLVFCIFAFSGGLSIVQHYCGNTLKQISLNAETDSCCSKHAEKQSQGIDKGCCVEKVSFFKTFDYEKSNSLQVFSLLPSSVVDVPAITETRFNRTPLENYSLPPPKLALFKQHQVFLI
jgi:hypothetical protein